MTNRLSKYAVSGNFFDAASSIDFWLTNCYTNAANASCGIMPSLLSASTENR